MGGREREMDRTHAGTTKGREQAPRLSDRSAGGRSNQCADEVIISCRFQTGSYGRWPLHAGRGTGLSQAINRQVALVGSGLVWWQLLS